MSTRSNFGHAFLLQPMAQLVYQVCNYVLNSLIQELYTAFIQTCSESENQQL